MDGVPRAHYQGNRGARDRVLRLPGAAYVKPMFGRRNGGELIVAFRLLDGGNGTITLATRKEGDVK